jgi:hypothetical protein
MIPATWRLSPPFLTRRAALDAAPRRLTSIGCTPLQLFAAHAVSLAAVAILGGIHLPHPFHGDKALYQFGGRVLAEGGVLYVDFWDLKKPGIYLFHATAGRLFGFSELGVHLLELCWLLAPSACMVQLVAKWLERWWLAALSPIVTVGMYYAVVSLWHLTQPAILTSFPLFVAMWLACTASGDPRRVRTAFAASGAAAGVATVFKLAVAPIPLAFWLVATVVAVREGERPGAALRDRVLMGVVGAGAVTAAVAAWFWNRGALWALVESTITFPAEAWWELGTERHARLGTSVRWFLGSVVPFVTLTLLSVVGWRGARRELPTLQLMAWGVSGGLAVLLEHYAWWPFDMLVLVVPVGLLAVRGVDGAARRLAAAAGRYRWAGPLSRVFPALALVAFVPALRHWWDKAGPVLHAARSDEPDWMEGYRRSFYGPYDYTHRRMGFLHRPDALPGAIYVIGDPLYQLRSGRPQAIPVNGWALETLGDERIRAVAEQLQRAAPAYVFVESRYQADVMRRAPTLPDWLARHYEPVAHDEKGTWHRRRGPATPAAR